jgi:hypothetical protein
MQAKTTKTVTVTMSAEEATALFAECNDTIYHRLTGDEIVKCTHFIQMMRSLDEALEEK